MTLNDVDQAAVVDRLSFTLPWPPETYRRDLRYQGNTHYLVVAALDEADPERDLVVGFCGYWMIDRDAHVSTICVHPGHRRKGLGEYLLSSLLADGIRRHAEAATLEVRVSNFGAQELYRKYGFEVTGRRRRYYRDNHEDALLMTVTKIDGQEYLRFLQERREGLRQRLTALITPLVAE